jgi:uncharacterized protein (TIGR02246 family)
MTEIETLLAEQACEKLIRRFARANDARDFDALAELLAEEASYARPTDPDNPMQGRDAIVASFRARPASRITRHVFANTVVTVESATEARAVSEVVLYAGAAVEGGLAKSDPAMIGAFEDRFVKREGRWLFLARKGSLALKAGGSAWFETRP